MNWSTAGDLRRQVERLWERGVILQDVWEETSVFPRRLVLKTPSSDDLAHQFPAVRDWCQALLKMPQVRFELREVRHRVTGTNQLPAEAWVDTADAAARCVGKLRELETFRRIVALVRGRAPALLAWLHKRPLQALEHEHHWSRFLDLVDWMQQHPRPGCYLRQVDIPGIDSKFIEQQRGVLLELLDLALPPERVDGNAVGVSGFCRRFGFLDKPARIRLRVLDPELDPLGLSSCPDLTLTVQDMDRLRTHPKRVYITENEVNFLAFPKVPQSWILFGAGYGFEHWAVVTWLRDVEVFYWGDIDTHGFAVLHELRGVLPQTQSFLMDRATLLHNRPFWTTETKPCKHDLTRLTAEEQLLYNELRDQIHGTHIRLEQERVPFRLIDSNSNFVLRNHGAG